MARSTSYTSDPVANSCLIRFFFNAIRCVEKKIAAFRQETPQGKKKRGANGRAFPRSISLFQTFRRDRARERWYITLEAFTSRLRNAAWQVQSPCHSEQTNFHEVRFREARFRETAVLSFDCSGVVHGRIIPSRCVVTLSPREQNGTVRGHAIRAMMAPLFRKTQNPVRGVTESIVNAGARCFETAANDRQIPA